MSLKMNSLRADTNAPNASISADKIKKIADDIQEVNLKVDGN